MSSNKGSKKKLSDFDYNNENPFLKQAIDEVQKNVVKRYRAAGKTDKKAILQAFDSETGEILGHTQFIRQIEVDEDQFAKFYLSNFSNFFDLKPSAIKVFGYVLNQLIPNKDYFYFILEDCMKYTGYKAKSSVFDGLAQLVGKNIIARGKTDFMYFLNPMVVFNGSRITFAKTYVKKQKKGDELPASEESKKEEDQEPVDPNQLSIEDLIKEAEESQKEK